MFSILYVDDEPMLLELAKLFLEKTGDFRVDTVTSATEALDILAKTSYDCIISDYQMPVMDGIVFLKTFRSKGNVGPFIIFTGKGREEVVIEALNNGADFYLQKGGDPKSQFVELAHKVRQAIQIRIAQKTMQDLVQGAPIPEFVIDSSHRVVFWNKALEEYSGIAASDVVGTTNHWKAFYPSQRPCLADLLVDENIDGIARWYAGKQPQVAGHEKQFCCNRLLPGHERRHMVIFHCCTSPGSFGKNYRCYRNTPGYNVNPEKRRGVRGSIRTDECGVPAGKSQ